MPVQGTHQRPPLRRTCPMTQIHGNFHPTTNKRKKGVGPRLGALGRRSQGARACIAGWPVTNGGPGKAWARFDGQCPGRWPAWMPPCRCAGGVGDRRPGGGSGSGKRPQAGAAMGAGAALPPRVGDRKGTPGFLQNRTAQLEGSGLLGHLELARHPRRGGEGGTRIFWPLRMVHLQTLKLSTTGCQRPEASNCSQPTTQDKSTFFCGSAGGASGSAAGEVAGPAGENGCNHVRPWTMPGAPRAGTCKKRPRPLHIVYGIV